MSKAILVMDMPESCAKCRFYWSYCQCCYRKTLDISKKPKFCPLKPVPEKLYVDELPFDDGFNVGWNACIDEILKEGE